jgi:hypothetical protein
MFEDSKIIVNKKRLKLETIQPISNSEFKELVLNLDSISKKFDIMICSDVYLTD